MYEVRNKKSSEKILRKLSQKAPESLDRFNLYSIFKLLSIMGLASCWLLTWFFSLTLKREAEGSSEASPKLYQTARRHIAEDINFYIHLWIPTMKSIRRLSRLTFTSQTMEQLAETDTTLIDTYRYFSVLRWRSKSATTTCKTLGRISFL
jgi:hypothetical protein